MMEHGVGQKAVWVALVANLAIFLIKVLGAWASGSAAMFSEALHSLADMFNSIFLLMGVYLSLRPADDEHPFGYGKEVYFWSFMASIFMLGVTSMGSIYKGYQHVINPQPLEGLGLPLAALVLSAGFEYYAVVVASSGILRDVGINYSGWGLVTRALANLGKVSNPAVKFVFFEDFVALLGVSLALVALILVKLTGSVFFDGLVSICIGLILGVMAVFLAWENREMIIGQAASNELEQKIGDTAMGVDNVTDVHNLKTMYVGPQDLLVNMEIELPARTTVEVVDEIVDKVEKNIKNSVPKVKHISIEAMPDDHVQDWHK